MTPIQDQANPETSDSPAVSFFHDLTKIRALRYVFQSIDSEKDSIGWKQIKPTKLIRRSIPVRAAFFMSESSGDQRSLAQRQAGEPGRFKLPDRADLYEIRNRLQ